MASQPVRHFAVEGPTSAPEGPMTCVTYRRSLIAETLGMEQIPTPEERRSLLMGRVRQRDTKPEMTVRRIAHALGYRFRVQRKDLPGRPDLVFPSRRKAIFVHGCFWHSHTGCKGATIPKSRTEYWDAKLAANRERDSRVESQLRAAGWEVEVIWECQTRSSALVAERLRNFLGAKLESKPS